ncbi:DUF4224 domain-containing protein [Massilia sp. CT11-137]|uniref:DUF4224 domain-containing protein n=1 Tax=Massilia sp. CT11-137 TaxID=3393901 RepID=UPI0039AE9B60
MAMFLTPDELAELTGRKIKSKQIEALRRMGLPFHVNASGKPVVPSWAAQGRAAMEAPKAELPVWIVK